jgi:SAM-dependent methyltransferase
MTAVTDGSFVTDRRFLTEHAYRDDTNFRARLAIYRWLDPPVDFRTFVFDQVEWRGTEVALDVGCGNGRWLRALVQRQLVARAFGFDLSTGMLNAARREWPDDVAGPALVGADVQHFPVRDAVADAALAMHMLYHVPDVPHALAELRRSLRPGGVLLASTNGPEGMEEMRALVADAVSALAGERVERQGYAEAFNLDNGAGLLASSFETVRVHRLDRSVVVPDVAPVVAYAASQAGPDALLPIGVTWDEVVAEIERRATAVISAEGAFRATVRTGVFVCR